MNATDYIIDILLIAIVFRQLRTRELTARNMTLPLLLIGWAGTRIGLDRLIGYGLKYDDHFQHTHLGRLGRRG